MKVLNGIIIDYEMGNVASVAKTFEKIGASVVVSRKQDEISRADFLVLPGVGAFGDGMENLKRFGLADILAQRVLEEKVPFLGICLGMQLLTDVGYEFGETRGLGFIKGKTVKLDAGSLRLPHVGWDNVEPVNGNSRLFDGIEDKNFYFVHSYCVRPDDIAIISATCDYGERFAAGIQRDNIFAAQFHPEKSQHSGWKFLENFLKQITEYA